MIDFHSHILPNIDDGSRSIEETFNLIKEAESVGFEAIISTSHYIEGYYETNTPEREVWINAIYENLKNKDISINLYLGNEIYLSENIIKDSDHLFVVYCPITFSVYIFLILYRWRLDWAEFSFLFPFTTIEWSSSLLSSEYLPVYIIL